jgi:hypothetical protein
MKKNIFLLVFVLNSFSFAQNPKEFTDLKGDYLGQTPPDSPAIFSPNGNEVYWVSS